MRFAVTFDLCRFIKRFPFYALLHVLLVESLTVILRPYREHDAVREIAVVCKRQDITSCFVFV